MELSSCFQVIGSVRARFVLSLLERELCPRAQPRPESRPPLYIHGSQICRFSDYDDVSQCPEVARAVTKVVMDYCCHDKTILIRDYFAGNGTLS
eukprot:2677583-Amphidinium_carterae.1